MHKLTTAFSLLALAGIAHAQQLVIPTNQTFVDTGSSALTWRSTAFHFQMMYDRAMFTAAGVTGPISINRLRFRGVDSYPNLGGQVFTGATVRLSDSPLTSATMLSTVTSATASTTTVIQTTGLTASLYTSGASDAQRCFQLTFTSGPNIGLSRFISANTATSVTVSVAFPSVPGVGDAFDIVRLPINYNNMAVAFASNVGANVGAPELLGPLTVGPAAGTTPNTYCLDVPLTTAAFVYDPTTMGDLMIEVTSPNIPAPNAGGLVNFGCSSLASRDHARRNSAASATAVLGGLSDFASVCLIDFVGPGGSTTATTGASVFSVGAGCGAQSTNIAQYFGLEDFDLRGPNSSIMFTPDNILAPNVYTATRGTTAVDLTKATGTANIADEGVTAHVLATNGWSGLGQFNYPGGSTTQITAMMNGYVWLSTTATSDFTPTVAEWLGGGASNLGARFAPAWMDWHGGRNTTTHPLSGMYVATDTTLGAGNAVTYVTWREIGQFNNSSVTTGGHSVNTFQCVFFEATGQVEMRYDAMAARGGEILEGGPLTGFTRGTLGGGINCTDSGSRDLSSELPFTSTANGAGLGLSLLTSARPVVGTSTTFTANNIPAGDDFGTFAFDFNAAPAGFQIPGVTAPGCNVNLALSPSFAYTFPGPVSGSATSLAFPAAVDPSVLTYPAFAVGYQLFVQFASLNFANGLTNVHTSNTLKLTVGWN